LITSTTEKKKLLKTYTKFKECAFKSTVITKRLFYFRWPFTTIEASSFLLNLTIKYNFTFPKRESQLTCLCHTGTRNRQTAHFLLSPPDVTMTVKGKAIQLQAWRGPVGSRRLKLPDFKTIGT
jgi:hypothetical protein